MLVENIYGIYNQILSKKNKYNKGITLVELLVAMVLVSFLMWPLYNVFRFSAKASLSSGDLTSAVNVASELIELLKNKPFDSICLENPAFGLKNKMEENEIMEYMERNFMGKFPKAADTVRFSRVLEITPLEVRKTPRGNEYAYVQVNVQVYWVDKLGNKKGNPVELFTLIPNENIYTCN